MSNHDHHFAAHKLRAVADAIEREEAWRELATAELESKATATPEEVKALVAVIAARLRDNADKLERRS